MTYLPEGDQSGDPDGYGGSLFIVGHDHQQMIAELSIPEPLVREPGRITELNVARMLQPFTDIFGGRVGELEIPRLGIEYLSGSSSGREGRLHFCVGQHFEFERTPTHGSKGIHLSSDDTRGLWFIGQYPNYVLNDYLFEIPKSWSSRHRNGYRLATGRYRDGQWGGLGPAVIAYKPPSASSPPPENATIAECVPLVMYGEVQPGSAELAVDPNRRIAGFSEADEWSGGAWLTAAEGSAMMLLGTKAIGKTWYGFSNGVVYPISGDPNEPVPDVPPFPHDQRGWWSESIRGEAILYDPEQLAAVARGELQPWVPQPYARVDLTPYLFETTFDHPRQKRYLLGACAFDRERGYLYVIERRVKVDEERSVVHVFRIGGS